MHLPTQTHTNTQSNTPKLPRRPQYVSLVPTQHFTHPRVTNRSAFVRYARRKSHPHSKKDIPSHSEHAIYQTASQHPASFEQNRQTMHLSVYPSAISPFVVRSFSSPHRQCPSQRWLRRNSNNHLRRNDLFLERNTFKQRYWTTTRFCNTNRKISKTTINKIPTQTSLKRTNSPISNQNRCAEKQTENQPHWTTNENEVEVLCDRTRYVRYNGEYGICGDSERHNLPKKSEVEVVAPESVVEATVFEHHRHSISTPKNKHTHTHTTITSTQFPLYVCITCECVQCTKYEKRSEKKSFIHSIKLINIKAKKH